MKNIIFSVVAAVIITPAFADQLVTDRPDHSILVTIESDPPGAEIYSIPASTNEAPVKIGITPHVALVELRWGTGWMKKKWSKMSVKTLGNLCQIEYFPEPKEYKLSMKFKAVAPGYQEVIGEEAIADFAYYDDLDFDNLKGIPTKATVRVQMTPAAPAALEESRKAAASTVIIAAQGEPGNIGTVNLDANVAGAEVTVDGKPAGVTPVRLVVREGEHEVVVQKQGFRSFRDKVNVSADSEISLKVKLDAALP